MAKKKKLTPNEIKERRKLRERARRERIRNNPQMYEKHLLEEKLRYIKNKEKGIIKLAKDMTARDLRQKRKKWRNNTLTYRRKKQVLQAALDNSPPESEIDVPLSSEERTFLTSTPTNSKIQSSFSSCPNVLPIPEELGPSTSENFSNSPSINEAFKSRQKKQGRKAVRRDRSKMYRENLKLRKENAKLKRKIEAIRKKKYRQRKKIEDFKKIRNSEDLTPNSKVDQVLQHCPSVPAEVRKNLLFGAALEHQLKSNAEKIKSLREKQLFAKIIQGRILKKYRLLTKSKHFLSYKMFKANNTRSNILAYERNKNARKCYIEKKVIEFYLSDENSTVSPGKKDTITRQKEKKQKKYLNNTLIELYKKFISQSNFKISYGLFCKYRPFWVVPHKMEARDTCLCTQHENFGFIVASLKKENVITQSSTDELIENLCCKPAKNSCYLNQCNLCKEKSILHDETNWNNMTECKKWVTRKEVRISAKTKQEISVKLIKKESVLISVGDLYVCLENIIPKFLIHLMNINHQFRFFTKLKNEVSQNEIIFHIDFSENYACKYSKEVQAVHFGASRQQITLHTGMMYTAGKQKPFCTLSDSLRHDPEAVIAHIMPLLKKYLNNKETSIDTLHFVSDSPSNQYRNKKIFYFLQHFIPHKFPSLRKITWNYSEAGHGKGAPDGVGATIKRTCDRLVALGKDIENFEKFVAAAKEKNEKIYIEIIKKEDIEGVEKYVPDFINSFKGTMKIHQVRWEKISGELEMHSLSCFKCAHDPCNKYLLGTYSNTFFDPTKIKENCTKLEKRKNLNQKRKMQEKDDQNCMHNDSFISDLQVGDWVKFKYQDEFFPGEIKKVDNNLITISAMETVNPDLRATWKWPKKPDIMEYSNEDIVKKISQPIPCGSCFRLTFYFSDETF